LRIIRNGCTYKLPNCAYIYLQVTYKFLTKFEAKMFTLWGQLLGPESAMENISNYGNVGYGHGIEVLNGILVTFDYKFNIR